MSAPADFAPIDAPAPQVSLPRARTIVDRMVTWLGDHLNPILVKETRQALKSRQFTITFALLLLFGWTWSILGIAWIGTDIRYGAYGATMFGGYYIILSFPLIVIVPFGAFRSLAAEQEDGTYELMSITTLGPRQIVRGKLGSAVLQMLVYLSAISPCLAFTYLLRGIDFPTILFILFYLVAASFGLSIIGLFFGTFSTQRHWQVVLSVVLIAGLLYGFGCGIALVMMAIESGDVAFGEPYFWVANAAVMTAYVSYAVLLFYAAVAQITFSSDNRSTRLRITMLAQYALFAGWMAWGWIAELKGEEEMLVVFMSFVLAHWWIMGALMTGESPELSSRVKRRLPQSFLGRAFLTWFNPGPGTGYLMAVASMCGMLAVVLNAVAVATLFESSTMSRWDSSRAGEMCAFGVVAVCYLTIYLGIGLLLARLLRRFGRVGIPLVALVQIVLVLLGVLVPGAVHLWNRAGYSLMQITNPFWTLMEFGESRGLPSDAPVVLLLLPVFALIVFLLNLPAVAREVRHVRIARPQRVAEEDAEIEALKHPKEPERTSPWD